jgi:serine/threonine-protein kinase
VRCGKAFELQDADGKLAEGTLVGNGRYLIEKLMGEGGMGNVYHAKDKRLGRDVALKVLHAELISHPTARRQFR